MYTHNFCKTFASVLFTYMYLRVAIYMLQVILYLGLICNQITLGHFV